jgi:hypothetical protein
VDKEIFEKLKNQRVQILNDEYFTISGYIKQVYEDSIAFQSNGKIRYLSFSRILEIRPL